jgi:hypothetical protein
MSNKITVSIIVVALIVVGLFTFTKSSSTRLGSVTVGNEYHSTTTIGKAGVTAYQVPECSNTLGTVNITSATALSALTIKDATSTTDLQARTIATFPATALGGEYTFDTVILRGLQLTIASGNGASTTVTCR